MSQAEVTNVATARGTERERIPMSLPMQKLAVPEMEGYHLHWMLGTQSRLSQALRAGYEFVDETEVDIVGTGLADDLSKSGNTDMGTRISVSAGADVGADGSEQRLYLMKLKIEWWNEDQAKLENRNEQVAAAIRGGQHTGDANPNGLDNRYIPDAHKKNNANILTPKNRRI